jgi:hypothetical protein
MKTTLILLSCLSLLAATSCKKKGCTDPAATNYDASAKVDDGSCTYPTSGTITDARDGQQYNFKRFGSQTWLTENMNYTTTVGQSHCYANSTANCDQYGRLYDHEASLQACPSGWHLPTRTEWLDLGDFLGGMSILETR